MRWPGFGALIAVGVNNNVSISREKRGSGLRNSGGAMADPSGSMEKSSRKRGQGKEAFGNRPHGTRKMTDCGPGRPQHSSVVNGTRIPDYSV
jgi:hypothetical protein